MYMTMVKNSDTKCNRLYNPKGSVDVTIFQRKDLNSPSGTAGVRLTYQL